MVVDFDVDVAVAAVVVVAVETFVSVVQIEFEAVESVSVMQLFFEPFLSSLLESEKIPQMAKGTEHI